MSDVQEKSVLDLMIEEQEKRNKEAQEAKERKASSSSNFEFEEITYFSLEDKKERVCRLLGLPAEIRKNPTDFKFILQSEILKDDKKSYLKVNWPIVERDGKLVPDPDWFLTKFLNKVREGKWTKYEDGKINEKTQKNGEWVKFHTETSVFKRVEGNSKPSEKFPKSFYPSLKVPGNVIDRHNTWCKDNKHSKLLVSSDSPFNFTNDKGEQQTIYYSKLIPKQCYTAITEHFKSCIGIKSLEDIDAVIIKDGKSETNKYVCYDKTDYPKYLKNAEAANLASNEPLTEEEKKYVLYDIDKLFPIASYAKLKRHLNGLFKLCDAELDTSFEKEIEALCKEEALNRPSQQNDSEVKNKVAEEQFTSLDDAPPFGTEPIVEEKGRREKKTEATVENKSIPLLCMENFPAWNQLSEVEKKNMIDNIISFKGNVPTYKTEAEDELCTIRECVFKGTKEPSSYPKSVNTCPVCGDKV
jgi:hypothetical protein